MHTLSALKEKKKLMTKPQGTLTRCKNAKRGAHRSCGLQTAEKTAKLAGEPERVCTFTPHFAGSARKVDSARLRHMSSAMSMNSLPP